jgi:hypothetical protein
MFRFLRTFGLPALVGLAVSAACSDDPPGGSDGGGAGDGGSPSGNGGKSGGTANKAGTGGKTGGTGGKTGGTGGKTGGSSGSTMVGGAGAGPGTGAQGGAGGAPECPGCASGFCLADGTCVDCLSSNDQCGEGTYCTDANECAPGCKESGDGCASGVCEADHNCKNCIADSECLAPLLCNDGTCSAACTAQAEGTMTGCDGGLTCCSLHCSELATDSKNCGSCGHACDTGQFCGAVDCGQGGAGGAGSAACVACHDTTFANICSISKIIVILDNTDDVTGNRPQGRKVGEALHTQCSPAPILTEAEQDSVDALNITTGRPVSGGGELLVVAGGPFYQKLEGYLEEQKIAPLYWKHDAVAGVTQFRKTADDAVVVERATAGAHDAQDDFIIQFSRDPASGSLVLNVQGFWLSGTVAAVYQITTGFLPQLETRDKGWYAYTWTDADGDKAPDANEIVLIASGN